MKPSTSPAFTRTPIVRPHGHTTLSNGPLKVVLRGFYCMLIHDYCHGHKNLGPNMKKQQSQHCLRSLCFTAAGKSWLQLPSLDIRPLEVEPFNFVIKNLIVFTFSKYIQLNSLKWVYLFKMCFKKVAQQSMHSPVQPKV